MEQSRSVYRKRGVDYRIEKEMYTLPGKYYHSEDIYSEELQKIFYKKWLLACREEEISNPGDYLTLPVGDESIIIVRNEEGRIVAHFNVCRHRGTRICREENGHFKSGRIKCPYHAWLYDLNGNLRGAPLMNEIPGFSKKDHGLFPVQLKSWGGFVFINLSEDPVPFEEELGELLPKFEDWHLPELRIAHKIPYTLNSNWKLIIQNYQECYHCPGVHPLLSELTPFRSAVHDCMNGAVIGGYMMLDREGGSMTMDGEAAGPPVCGVSGEDLQRIHYYSIFPNFLLTLHPDFVMYHRIRTIDAGKIQNDCFFLLHPDVINNPNQMERFQSAIDFWDLTNRQDWEVCEQMQQGTKSHRFEKGRYSAQEDILYAIDKEVLKALGHE